MAKARGEVSIEADGNVKGVSIDVHVERLDAELRGRYVLVFSTNALCEMEDRLDAGVASFASLATGGKRFKTIRTVFLCGLLDHHPNLTERDAGRIIDAIGIAKADAAVGEAFALAFPEAQAAPVPLEMPKTAPAKRSARTG